MTATASLPTLDRLGSTVPPDTDVLAVALQWFDSFAQALQSGDVDNTLSLLLEDVFWRDMLSLTWDIRTFQGAHKVRQFLTDQLPLFPISSCKLRKHLVQLQTPYPDIAWIQAFFDFETPIGIASGVFRLVPLRDGSWKAHAVYTNLEDLKGHPEKHGPLRDHQPNHGKWAAKRAREIEFLDEEPRVVVIGAGHGGLCAAARLKMLGVNALVVDKNERIGDNWRNRYEALCLHDPVWYDHMPYLPFPPSWPVYTPALKIADWLESYAHSMELNVWTSSSVMSVVPGTSKRWKVSVAREGGSERVFEVDNVVFAIGFGGNKGRVPDIPGMDEFKGQILHSSHHKFASDHGGKKVAVIGSCTSAHDICADYVESGVDVTMVQRGPTYVMSAKEGVPRAMVNFWEGGPPTDVADRMGASFPRHLAIPLAQRLTRAIAEADKELLDGLRARGFKLTFGIQDAGFALLGSSQVGGFYFDVGASQLIIDGKIKLKSDGPIKKITSSGLLFEDGSTLDADVILFATGYSDARTAYLELLPSSLAPQLQPIWGLNAEGELNSATREVGIPGIYCVMGNFAMGRFESKHLALQIKAYEEGLLGKRYHA
ncbi:FAD/NAD(P)-binding domain-containing protein [Leucogyrophana mollusca]|uniref:FAD/NAD(P)-binding domain-containing protein n=1 Tax=Leucogyrophana mollusca TaxID=85980 RepID=A0ACB8BAB9_9AGAM|nr:FAD/NAD(P)-binding domain-containing protein [Leucogyrophana mollusca]